MGNTDAVMPHTDHRNRMRDRFEKDGIFSFKEHEVLEMLLFGCLPRRNTNDVSHSLLDRFGSMNGVLAATSDELREVEGVGKKSADFLKMMGGVFQRITSDMATDIPFDSREKAGIYACLMMRTAERGSTLAVYLDKDRIRIAQEWVARGREGDSTVMYDTMLSGVRRHSPKELLIIHEHQNEPEDPSPDDFVMSDKFLDDLRGAGVEKVTQIIVTDDGYVFI